MKAILTEEQQILVSATERRAADGIAIAKGVLLGGKWPEQPDLSLMAEWQGLAIPESQGGAGGSLVDLALVAKALSSQLVPNCYLDHVIALQAAVGAGLALNLAESHMNHCCLAVTEPRTDSFGPFSTRLNDGKIDGLKTGVPFGSREVYRAARNSAQFRCDGCAYAKERVQFNRPIGSFQGVAHQLADALVSTETAWSLTLYACWAIDNGRADAAKAVHCAKAKAAEAAVFSSERALQVHGGMGMTWEGTPHLFLKRALARSAWLGGKHWHRRQTGLALLQRSAAVS